MSLDFQRRGGRRPEYSEAVEDLLAHTDNHLERGVADNLILDHRISPDRDAWFDEYSARPRTGRELSNALTDYYRNRIATISRPEFLDEKRNADNFLAGAADLREPLLPSMQLATVISVNAKIRVLASARRSDPRLFPDLSPDVAADPQETEVARWLDSRLTNSQSSQRETDGFIESVLEALSQNRRTRPHHPVWATSWERFRAFQNEPAERWTALVGVPREFAGQYLFVLRYSVSEAGTVVRPTQLEAGWNAVHFPSPPVLVAREGGRTMDLSPEGPPLRLTPEFIHEEIDFRVEHWVFGGRLIKRTNGSVGVQLPAHRERHREALVRRYGYKSIREWMPTSVWL